MSACRLFQLGVSVLTCCLVFAANPIFQQNSLRFPLDVRNWALFGDAKQSSAGTHIELVSLEPKLSLSYGGLYSVRPLPLEFFEESTSWTCDVQLFIDHGTSRQFQSDFVSILFTQKNDSFLDFLAPSNVYHQSTSPFFGVMIELLELTSAKRAANVHVYGISNEQHHVHPAESDVPQSQNSCQILLDSPDFIHIKVIKEGASLIIKVNECGDDDNRLNIGSYVSSPAQKQASKLHLCIAASSTNHGLRRSLTQVDFAET